MGRQCCSRFKSNWKKWHRFHWPLFKWPRFYRPRFKWPRFKWPSFTKNSNGRYRYLVLGHKKKYFVKEHSDCKTSTLKMTSSRCLSSRWQYFRGFCRKSLPAELCPSSRQHLSVFIRSGLHTGFALNGKESISISVQSDVQVHRWCIVHKQPRIRKLSGTDVSCWTWYQGHHRVHHFCYFLDLLLSIGRDGQLHTSIYDKRDDFIFHITNFPSLSSYISAYGVFISQLVRYAWACSSYECFIPVS